MRVRVFDKENNCYFKSEVYATVNSGIYEKMLVVVHSEDGKYLKFFESVDMADKYKALINRIPSVIPAEWVRYKADSVDEQLEDYAGILNSNIRFYEYHGFDWLWNNKEILLRLLEGEKVSVSGSIFENRLYSDNIKDSWNYIDTSEDADFFMKEVCDLHDSVITEMSYVSGGKLNEDGSLTPGFKPILNVKIQSQICGNVEMEFIGLTALNLRPTEYGFSDIIMGAGIICKDGYIYFKEEYTETIDPDYDGTWAASYDFRWKLNY